MRCFFVGLKQCIFTFYSVLCEHIKDFAPLIRHLTAPPSPLGKANAKITPRGVIFCVYLEL